MATYNTMFSSVKTTYGLGLFQLANPGKLKSVRLWRVRGVRGKESGSGLCRCVFLVCLSFIFK